MRQESGEAWQWAADLASVVRAGISVHRFEPEEHLRRLGVVDIVASPIERAAMLLPTKNGFRIKLSVRVADDWAERRWALAHELGHIYFFDTTLVIPSRSWPASLPRGTDEELACEAFAECLLLPARDVARASAKSVSAVAAAVDLWRSHSVPLEAATAAVIAQDQSYDLVALVGARSSRSSMRVAWTVTAHGIDTTSGSFAMLDRDKRTFVPTVPLGKTLGIVRLRGSAPRTAEIVAVEADSNVLVGITFRDHELGPSDNEIRHSWSRSATG